LELAALADADDIADAISENAQGPASASNGPESMQQHKLPDQIAAQKFAASRGVSADPFTAVRRIKMEPPGTA
jgi:hypothetical protein